MTPRPRLRERSASVESRSELCSLAFPGDTLPWNLAKHQRVKRSKSASGDVLDPAERAVIRIAGKRRSELENYFCYSTVKHNTLLLKRASCVSRRFNLMQFLLFLDVKTSGLVVCLLATLKVVCYSHFFPS